ncbi:orexin receptor type 2-like [Xenia sp. Carnegie-2017]|uniref:orexin receptor type 2-like n=1 Tax=Xenia sp. Carnegie-2017 TaxID=2897299 RepID=UPI001F04015C|nr:orexin receptor type 2-like [Xenia sp. Carnegie-2017]
MNETSSRTNTLTWNDLEGRDSVVRDQWGATVLQLCLSCLIAVVGFVGNVLVLVAAYQLYKHRTHRNTRSTYYIINLSLADLSIILLALPLEMLMHFTSWPFGEFTCKFIYPLRDVFVMVAIMTITALSVERYWVITGPFKAKPNQKHARIIIASIWVIGYLYAGLPLVFVMKLVKVTDNNFLTCETSWKSTAEERVHVILTLFACLVVPSCIITFCYIKIAKSLQKLQARRTSIVPQEGKPTTSVISLVEQSKKVAKMLVIIVVAFCCCVLPYTMFALVAQFGHIYGTHFVWYSLFISLFFAHSAVNPVILIIMSKEYRSEVAKIVRRLRDVCWKVEAVRAYFTDRKAHTYRQHRIESENGAQLMESPGVDGEQQQKSTEL